MRELPAIKSTNMDTYGEEIVYQEKNESTAREVRTVSNLRKMFSFNSERHWINKAKAFLHPAKSQGVDIYA